MPAKFELIAPCFFGCESTAKFELTRIGAENIRVEDGRLSFAGGADMIAAANLSALAGLLLSLFGAAVWARRFGLLTQFTWLPGPQRRRPRSRGRLRVVEATPPKPSRAERKQHNAEAKLDALLDKINASGMDSLTKSELAELRTLSKNRKRS